MIGTHECSCPDFQHRGVECKHITAVKLYVAKIQAERSARRSHPLSAEPLPCTGCHGFHLTAEDRIKAHPDENRHLVDGGATNRQVMRAAGEWPR
jgi:SWIM zinc finger